jgi:SAM-dependent methyltransferase
MGFRLVQRTDYILEACEGKRVLHLGCTNWPYTQDAIDKKMLLHFDIEERAGELYGLDFDQQGLDVLAAAGSKNLFQGDLEKLELLEDIGTFDVVIAGEMIEHLNNQGLFLHGVQRFLGPSSKLLITTINAYGASRIIQYALRGKGGLIEPVHPDHVAYYSYSTLKLLVERAGFVLNDFCYYDIGPEHRPYNRRIGNWFNDFCMLFAPQMADGVIAVCELPGTANTANDNE